MSINEPSNPMRLVSDILLPRFGDIVTRLDLLLAKLGQQVPGGDTSLSLSPLVLGSPVSPADIALAYLAAEETGLVTPRPQRYVSTVLAGGNWTQTHNVPANTVAIFLNPIEVVSTLHDALVTATLTVDGRVSFLNAQSMQNDVSLEFSKYIVAKNSVSLTFANGAALNTVATLNLPLAEVALTYYEDKIRPVLIAAYSSLLSVGASR